jgi:hypothetical protein
MTPELSEKGASTRRDASEESVELPSIGDRIAEGVRRDLEKRSNNDKE